MSGVSARGRRFRTERWCLLAVTSLLLLTVPALCQEPGATGDPVVASSPTPPIPPPAPAPPPPAPAPPPPAPAP
eukprot:CAMPEP_0180124810 /NCGR_PEP_ID=MMETSP0986-20121125/4849_1 /TAXON_ID=697907 /ORGANISM="non described non described, Strain CCMP2293" /LENGTH=73 /DNA_ID=CAMNT_0022064173 /DNA_START=10 /DNA_END=228 /DNA_ORIENTATION=-